MTGPGALLASDRPTFPGAAARLPIGALCALLVAGCQGAGARDPAPAPGDGPVPPAEPASGKPRSPGPAPPRRAPAPSAPAPDAGEDQADPAAPAAPAPSTRGSESARPPAAKPRDPGTVATRSTPAAKVPSRAPASPPPATSGARGAAEYLRRLQAGPEAAAVAYRELWEAPRELIPQLILNVASDDPSSLKELSVLVIDKEHLARIDEGGGSFTYDIPGLRNVKYDDIVVGKASRGAKVILRSLKKPFPVGVVLRAALLNRFQSTDYPSGDDGADPVRWWQRFHERVHAKL